MERSDERTPMDAQERAWLDEYRKGSREALGMLVEQYRRPLYSFILKMTEGRTDADEVFQEVWIRAIRKLDTFREENLLGWLFRIAHNLIIDLARRRKPFVQPSSPGTHTQSSWINRVPAGGIGPASETAGRDLGQRIRQEMVKLPPEQREVFLLRTEGEVPFKEIAKIQGVSLNTALARMHYAVLKLREALKDEYRDFGGTKS
jgi:RNA polymerase sigma-70 factor (ECF subfamily)